MKLAVILGNGFDLNLGIKTSYSDFYQYFITQEHLNPQSDSKHPELIRILGNDKLPNWADLELLLGGEIGQFSDANTLRNEKEYLEQRINDYLKIQQQRVRINTEDLTLLRKDFDKNILNLIEKCGIRNSRLEDNEIFFMSFNYTDVIARIIRSVTKTEGTLHYHEPSYIHGRIDDRVILGVDNESQLRYTRSMFDAGKIKRIMVKPVLNASVRPRELSEIEDIIRSMDAIIVFGASIGDTDGAWWREIANWVSGNSGHILRIIGYVNASTPASATAYMRNDDYEERFISWIPRDRRSTIRPGMIRAIRKEDDMFRFDKALITVTGEGSFDNLILSD